MYIISEFGSQTQNIRKVKKIFWLNYKTEARTHEQNVVLYTNDIIIFQQGQNL